MISTSRTRTFGRVAALLALDAAALWIGWRLATDARLGSYWGADFRTHHWDTFAVHSAVFLAFSALFETYDPRRLYATWKEVRRLVGTYLLTGLVELLIFYFRTEPEIGRGVFALNVGAFSALAIVGRVLYGSIGVDFFRRRAIVVTSGDVEASLVAELKRASASIYDLQGYIAPGRDFSAPNTVPWLGDGQDLDTLLAARRIETVMVSSNLQSWQQYLYPLITARHRGLEILDFTEACERFLNRIPSGHASELWLLWGLMGRSPFYVTRLKRLLDLALVVPLLLVALPLMAVIALAILLTSGRPVFYTQERIGQYRKQFNLLKFRSMVRDAEEESGPVWASENDPRVTRIGRFLRRWRFDELPQLLNVVKGDMSLVGPRPERAVFVSELRDALPMYEQRHALRPGITGWGQIHYNYAASREESREKLEYDLFYIKNASFVLDLSILFRTTRAVVERHGR